MTPASPTFDAQPARVAVSIVSHGHGTLVTALLADLAAHCGDSISVVLTLNVPEPLAPDAALPFPVALVRNPAPKGFGANHNAAFRQCREACFCVLNPDVRLGANPFPRLIAELAQPRVGVAAPRIVDPAGRVEDSARRFPTPGFILRKLAGTAAHLDHEIGREVISPDWVAGMFMLFRSAVFAELQGFDERYFLYYEDVDLCRRLRARGYDVRLVPSVSATHDARRESRRSLRHLRWHAASMLRYFVTRKA
ncbi:MAG TPA: glycosyltransferase family 2 protein [Burkholderiales bacterium]|nr:glycosyltransferase family 2 protein [Burkholderiales bacterium]